MPTPTTPTLVLNKTSTTSFSASVTGQAGVTHRLFYRFPTETFQTGPTRTGDGTISVTGLRDSRLYEVLVQSDDGGYLSFPTLGTVSLRESDTLLSAVKTAWDSSPMVLTKAGRLYVNEVPERKADGSPVEVPYTFVRAGRTRFVWDVEDTIIETTNLDFFTFTKGAVLAEEAREAIRDVFEWEDLPFLSSTSTTVSAAPLDFQVRSEHIRYIDGSLIYSSLLGMEFRVQRVARTGLD